MGTRRIDGYRRNDLHHAWVQAVRGIGIPALMSLANSKEKLVQFSYNQLKVLWYLKRHGPIERNDARMSLMRFLAEALDLDPTQVQRLLHGLEKRNVVLRTHRRKGAFASGGNPLLRVELVDPKMSLPPLKAPNVEVVIAQENRALDELTAHEPSTDAIVHALVDRIVELQAQVDKLQGVVEALNAENEKLRKRTERRQPSEHLTQRVRDVLTPEQWADLRHSTEGGAR